MHRIEFRDLLPASLGLHRSRQGVLNAATGDPITTMSSVLELPSNIFGADSAIPRAEAVSDATTRVNSTQLIQLNNQLGQLSGVQQTSIASIAENSRAVMENTVAKTSAASSALSVIGSASSSTFAGGFAISPILSGLLSLFGSGSQSSAASPLPFTLPPAIKYDAGMTGNSAQVLPVSYGEGQPRTIAQSAPAQVIVQVNAMDSKSFVDHSEDIALAVRQAMLKSNSLNDVIADL